MTHRDGFPRLSARSAWHVDARPAQACPAGQRGDVRIKPRYDGHGTARSPFGEIERKALDSGTCRSADRAPNV